jgi:hypothetical protein
VLLPPPRTVNAQLRSPRPPVPWRACVGEGAELSRMCWRECSRLWRKARGHARCEATQGDASLMLARHLPYGRRS